jgi:hypothetical protein
MAKHTPKDSNQSDPDDPEEYAKLEKKLINKGVIKKSNGTPKGKHSK